MAKAPLCPGPSADQTSTAGGQPERERSPPPPVNQPPAAPAPARVTMTTGWARSRFQETPRSGLEAPPEPRTSLLWPRPSDAHAAMATCASALPGAGGGGARGPGPVRHLLCQRETEARK